MRAEPVVDQDLYPVLLDALAQSCALLDAWGGIRVANASFLALLGTSDAAGLPWRDFLATDQQPAWDAAFAQACRGEAASCAATLRSLDDIATHVEIGLRPVGGRGEPVEAIALTVREPLRERSSDEMLRWVAHATAPLTGTDFFQTLMRRLAEAFGLRRGLIAECVDRPVTRVRTLAYWFDAEMRPNFEFTIAGTPCERTIRDGRVFCMPCGLGERYPRARQLGLDGYLGAPIFDSSGASLIGHLAFETAGTLDTSIQDNPLFQIFVSRAAAELRRKRAEDVLRESEANYRLLVEHQTDVVAKYDAGQRLLFVSPSFCHLFGREEGTLLGTSFRPELAEEEATEFQSAWDALALPPHETRFEERVRTAHGWRCIAWSQKAMVDAQGRIEAVVVVGRDVTDRLRAEEQARQHLQQLAHVGRVSAMGEMASAIAHEINQPLTAVRTYAQACRRLLAAGADPAELAGTLQRTAELAERAAQIIRRLRRFLAKEELHTMPVAPERIVSAVVDLCRADAARSGVQLKLDLCAGVERVAVDCLQIEQVVFNLARNGIEAMQANAPGVPRTLLISTRQQGGEVLISVKDTGPGVPGASRRSVFDAFHTTKPNGMGIGLAISRSIAQAHGGRLWLDEAAAPGALFHLALPGQGREPSP